MHLSPHTKFKKNFETWCLVVYNYVELSCYSSIDLKLEDFFSHNFI